MTKEQFQALAEAYGGTIARWPVAVRDEAALLAAAEPEFAREVLAREEQLDAALDALPLEPASASLSERILADAPRRRRRWTLWLAPAGVGAALAGIAAAGLVLGVQLGDSSSLPTDTSAVADLDVTTVAEVG